MKKAKRFVSLLLVAVMTLYLLAGCGDKNRKTEKAQVNYPVPTDAEAEYEEEYNEATAEATIFIDQICGRYDMDGKRSDEGDQGSGGYVELSAILTVKPLEKNKVEIYSSVFGGNEEKDGEGEINPKTGELKYNNQSGNPVSITFNITADGVSAVYHTEEEFDVDGEHYKSAIDMKGNKIKE